MKLNDMDNEKNIKLNNHEHSIYEIQHSGKNSCN